MFTSYQVYRAVRKEGGIYANTPKVETSTKAEALRIAANGLKDARLRQRVVAILIVGLENADDTNADGFGRFEQEEFKTREAFWAHMFIASVQDALSRETDKRVSRFFDSRGVRA
jgi:hypothetical protein